MSPETRKTLTVVGVVACCILVAAAAILVLLTGLGRARASSRLSVCATNLKGLGTSAALFAATNADGVTCPPAPAFGGTWMCDQPTTFLTAAAAPAGLPAMQKLAYCPSNANQDPAVLWATAPYRVIGYVWTNDRSNQPAYALPPLAGIARVPPLEYHKSFSKISKPGETELALDWIISPTPAGTHWTGITAPGRPGTYDTSHLNGKRPAGANVVTFDGHVAWRPFDPAKATPVQQGGGPAAPVFWFPHP